MTKKTIRLTTAIGAAGVLAGALVSQATAQAATAAPQHPAAAAEHVLLLSVDGLHQTDLAWYIAQHPKSALARLVHGGTEYTHARTTIPSDSFPGMVAQVTGGTPGTTGVYYDDTYSSALYPAGTTDCKTAKLGAEVDLTEDIDKNKDSIDAGQGLKNLPQNVLAMSGNPLTNIDLSKLPVDPKTCKPLLPSSYLRANTVFSVAQKAGLRTAWSDKHIAYQILDGHSGSGIDDMFSPEINSQAAGYPAGDDWSKDNKATEQYDNYKVEAVLNEIDGKDHSGTKHVGTPAVFGMNFQSVSTAQKLPASDGLKGGYTAVGTPGPLVAKNLDYINAQVGRMLSEINKDGLAKSTTVILSAKHGQSPTKPAALNRIDDGKLIDGLNAAWRKAHPKATADLVAHAVDDDGMLLWLSDRSQAAAEFAKHYLLAQSGTGTDINKQPKAYARGGLQTVYAGVAAAKYFGTGVNDDRVPQIFGISQYGVVYTGGTGKIAEHGGAHADDLDVPLVVSGTGAVPGAVFGGAVHTTSIAPTILQLLGLNPESLSAVRADRTPVLPLKR